MVLADTSVWVEYLRREGGGRASRLGTLVDRHELMTCGPVVAELIAGAGEEDQARLERVLDGLPWAELDRGAWSQVGLASAVLRGSGQEVPLTDVEIAVAASRAGASVWSADSDFERLAPVIDGLKVLPLG